MTMRHEDIEKAFANRWRIKGFDEYEVRQLSGKEVRLLCLDFFETAALLADSPVSCDTIATPIPPIVCPHEPILDTADGGFSEWWEMYGKKIDRGKCEKKWAKLSLEEKQACIAATPAYVASTPDLKYRRNPMTYLNNKSWKNQIIDNGTDKQQQSRQRIAEAARTFAKYAAPSGGDTE